MKYLVCIEIEQNYQSLCNVYFALDLISKSLLKKLRKYRRFRPLGDDIIVYSRRVSVATLLLRFFFTYSFIYVPEQVFDDSLFYLFVFHIISKIVHIIQKIHRQTGKHLTLCFREDQGIFSLL